MHCLGVMPLSRKLASHANLVAHESIGLPPSVCSALAASPHCVHVCVHLRLSVIVKVLLLLHQYSQFISSCSACQSALCNCLMNSKTRLGRPLPLRIAEVH